jgi:signal transduction histidine kinase|uniref:histidine kinase n=1 Tax=candidate division WOR-3 bacterium TaxID=2052148 RepID=A0A7V3UZ19_UNCW3
MRRITIYSVILAILVLIVFNIHSWLVLTHTRAALEEELGTRLENLAVVLATRLKGWEKSEEITPVLSEAMNFSNLLNIFLIDESLRFIVNLREPQSVGQPFPAELDEAEIQSAFSGLPARTRLYTAGPAILKTAYAPIYDNNGIIKAVLGVEADARFFRTISTYYRTLLFINGLSLLAIIAIIITYITLNRYALKLEHKATRTATFALLGEMSAALAHDLRNPIATILAATENIRLRYNLSEDKTLSYIKEQIERVNAIINNYLDIGANKPAPLEPIDIDQLIKETLVTLSTEIRKQNIAVETLLNGLPPIPGSAQQLRQLFMNLLLNAIQAQPNGGSIRISGELKRTSSRKWAVIKITDRGPGIPRKLLARIFEPFFTTKEKGSGLGLFIAKKIVDLHHGQITISSQTGIGTTVEVKLPV